MGGRTSGLTWFTLVPAGVAVASLTLPWAGSGQADRSGLELARVAVSSGLVGEGSARALLVAVGLTPLLFGLAWMAALLDHPAGAAACVLVVASTVALAAGVVRGVTVLRPYYGTWVGIVASMTAVALVLTTILGSRLRRYAS